MLTTTPTRLRGNHYHLRLTESDLLRVQKDALSSLHTYKAGVRQEPISTDEDYKHWAGSYNLQQAYDWYTGQWTPGLKQAKEVRHNIAPRLKELSGHLAEVRNECLSLTGRRLDMQAAIEDKSPEHYRKEKVTNSGAFGGSKLVNAFIQGGTPHFTDPKDIMRFGLTLVETISMLESYNLVRFRICLLFDVENFASGQSLITTIQLKDYHTSIPKNRLLCAIAAPFMLRRFWFNLMDTMPQFDADNNNYGCPVRETNRIQQHLAEVTKREPVNTLWSVANIQSGQPILDSILEPLCQTQAALRQFLR